MPPDRPMMDLDEFRDSGYLQEINRRFLHPLGLALGMTEDEDGSVGFAGVWDARHDPDGFVFEGIDLGPKAEIVRRIEEDRRAARVEGLGFWVQPAGPSELDAMIERAREIYIDEYRKHFPSGGDEQDHYEAQRAAMEAVVIELAWNAPLHEVARLERELAEARAQLACVPGDMAKQAIAADEKRNDDPKKV